MPNARIEIEYVERKWIVQVEASSYLTARRATVTALTADDAFHGALAKYKELAAIVEPPIAAEGHDEQRPQAPIVDATKPIARRGRHPNACECAKCIARRVAA